MRKGPAPSLLSLRADFKPAAWFRGAWKAVSVGLDALSEVGAAGRELLCGKNMLLCSQIVPVLFA